MLPLMAGIVYIRITRRTLWGEPEQVQVHNME